MRTDTERWDWVAANKASVQYYWAVSCWVCDLPFRSFCQAPTADNPRSAVDAAMDTEAAEEAALLERLEEVHRRHAGGQAGSEQ